MQGAPTSARPTTWMDANSPNVVHGVGGCCAERRGRRSLPGVCEFAEGGIKPFPCAAGAVEDAGPYSCAATNARHPFLPPAGEGGIRRSPARRMTEEGERDRLLTVKIVDLLPRLRSFPRRGPATFSLSCRPCGRHPPPLGEGMGECAFDELNGPSHPKRFHVGRADPGAPRSSTEDKQPRPANSQHFLVGGGVPTPRQQHQRQAPSPANLQPFIVGGGVPTPRQRHHSRSATSGEFAAFL